MFDWGPRQLSSEDELKGVQMRVYTKPAGLIGRFIGRALCFRIDDFSYFLNRKDGNLQRVEVEASSITPECEVYCDAVRSERVGLTFSEVARLKRRLNMSVLDIARYPIAEFDVESDESDEMKGVLHFHGKSHPITCVKQIQARDLLVRCPISMRKFNIPPYGIWLGLLSVADEVDIETRVSLNALKL
ncbi:unnamed protein product [Phytomonas sp. Hart1]|nr:unnamed protein product [Phytomonas sp. Hart1]|eukprot:CCW67503.1 unnamed protein product [Phytomonas sp. isolate Hart1]